MDREAPTRSPRFDFVVASLEGHRPFYLRLCLKHARSMGATSTVHAPGSKEDLAPHDRDLLSMADWRLTSDPSDVDDLAGLDSDRLVVLDGDVLGRATAARRTWPRHAPLVALSLRGQKPAWHRNPVRLTKSLARYVITQRLSRRPGVRVLTLASPSEAEDPAQNSLRDPVRINCSPKDVERFSSEVLGRTGHQRDDIFWFGVVGVINHRKNVRMIGRALRAAAAACQLESPGLLLAGPVAEETRGEVAETLTELGQAGIPVRSLDERLDDPTFDAAIGAIDAVVVAYSNDGPSGVLAKAARLGTRVAAAGSTALRRDVTALDLGAWGELTVDGVRRALVETAHAPAPEPATHLDDADFARRLLGPLPMRILAWPAFRHRWANPYTAELADHLVAGGHEVREFGPGLQLLRRHDVILLHWPEFAPTHPSRIVRTAAAPAMLALLRAHQALGRTALIWTIHNVRPHKDPNPALTRWFMDILSSRLNGLIALNKTSVNEAVEAYPALIRTEQLLTRHPAYRIERRPSAARSDAPSPVARFLAELAPDTRLLVAWGKLEPYKQLVDLAEEALQLEDGSFTLIAGRCEDSTLAHRLRERSALAPDRLGILIGHIDDADLASLLGRADAVVFNFSDITNSGSIIASLSADVPVIAPSHPGLQELRSGVGQGWVRLFDPPLRASELQRLVDSDPPIGPALSDDSDYAWSTVAAETEQFLGRIVYSQLNGPPRERPR